MASLLQAAASSSISLSLLQSKRRGTLSTISVMASGNASKPPTPPIDPKDSFLSRLASTVSTSLDMPGDRRFSSDAPPYLDLFESPHLMATPAEVAGTPTYSERKGRTPPPDLPSMLLDGRIVYIGMPLVPAVTELVVAELIYLQFDDPKKPIYIYINSTGTTRDDNQPVGMETEGFAIYDTMMQLQNELHTVGVGAAVGHACLLLAAGTKGKRYMMPHARALIQQPRVPSGGLMPSSDVMIRAREALHNRDTLIELLAKHTGNSVEKVTNSMKRPFYMDSRKAREFGVVDRVLWRGQEEMMEQGDIDGSEQIRDVKGGV